MGCQIPVWQFHIHTHKAVSLKIDCFFHTQKGVIDLCVWFLIKDTYQSKRKSRWYIYLDTDIYGNQQFIYSWKPVLTNKSPAGKNDITEGKHKKDLNDGIDTLGGKNSLLAV